MQNNEADIPQANMPDDSGTSDNVVENANYLRKLEIQRLVLNKLLELKSKQDLEEDENPESNQILTN